MSQQMTGNTYIHRLIEWLDAGQGDERYGTETDPDSWVKVIMILEGGVVLRGSLVHQTWFMNLNMRESGGTWPDEESIYTSRAEGEGPYAHVTNVEYLSGGDWISGSNQGIDVNIVKSSGDRW